jgi:hypothetical protein
MTRLEKRDAIVAQCWTVFYQWISAPRGEGMRLSLAQLFQLLERLDPDSYDAVFDAALRGDDFPPQTAARYPRPN